MRVAVALLVLCLLAGSGCVYRTTTRGRTLQGTVSVPFLDNRTGQPDIELRLTDLLIEALESDGNLQVVGAQEGQYLLTGAIVRYSEAPFSIGAEGKADEYKLSIFADLTFFNRDTGEEVWRDKRFSGNASFYLEGGEVVGSGTGGDQTDTQFTRDWAEDQAITQITEDVLNVIFGEW